MANTKSGGGKSTQNKKSSSAKGAQTSKSSKAAKDKFTAEQAMARRQKSAIIFMAVAIFLSCVVIIEGQNVWTFMHNGMLGLFGYCAYVWPLMLVYMAIVCALDKPLGSISVSLAGIAAFIVLIGGAIHIFANEKEYLQTNSLMVQIQAAWDQRVTTPNGGVFGALVGGLLAKLFGKPGAQVTIVLLLIVMFMFLTGTTLFGLFQTISKPVKKVSQYTGEKMEQKALKREENTVAKKPFNPPKVLPKEEVANIAADIPFSEEFVPAVPADTLSEPLPIDTEFKQEPISIPSIKKGGKKATLEDIVKAASSTKTATLEKPAIKEPEEKLEMEEDIFKISQNYRLPPIDCLNKPRNTGNTGTDEDMKLNGQKLIETLQSFGVQAKIVMISRGPSVTRYELQPDAGVRINKITNLADDIALRLAASSVRIEAPIPNKSAIGIEVPNTSKSSVLIREIIDTPQFKTAKSKLNVALGKDITGNVVCADLVKMPHLLIAGTTGSGKSVCLNTLIVSLLYHATPDEVKLLLIDPKAVELAPYNGIAHLEVPVVSDPRKAAGALGWAVTEMQNRYKLFMEKNVRDIEGYNKLADKSEDMKRMHQVVIFIDELNDLMMVAPNEVEDSICRLAQMARAAGMHLVIATQRPSVDVITGIIKANIPSRIALSVSSQVDSRTIIDMAGAEKLLGSGDMLFNPVGISKPVRIQGCYISEQEIEDVVSFIKNQTQSSYDEGIMEEIERNAVIAKKKGAAAADNSEGGEQEDEMLPKAIEVVVEAQMASTTLLQRRLKLGYARAARLVDVLETKGIVGPFEGSKPRKVLISKQQWMEMSALNADYANAELEDSHDYNEE